MLEALNPYPFPRKALEVATQRSTQKRNEELTQGVYSAWDFFHETTESHQDSFQRVFPIGIREHIRQRLAENGVCYAFDVMGPGTAISHTGLTEGLALTLNTGLAKVSPEISVIDGDVNLRRNWRRAHSWLKERNIPGFDLVVFRPLFGLRFLPFNPRGHFALLQRMWSVLNPNGGVLLAEGHRVFSDDMQVLLTSWDKTNAIEYSAHFPPKNYVDFLLRLTKHPDSPKMLPTPSREDIIEAQPSSLFYSLTDRGFS